MRRIQEREERKKILTAGMRQILDAAEAAGRRSLTRAEQKKYDALESQLEEIGAAERYEAEQRRQFDPRSAQGDPWLDDHEAGATLAPEQRLADWSRGRGGDPLAELDQRLSLGAIVQARVHGDHRHLTDLEKRVLGESSDSVGGVLVPEILSARIIDRARAQSVAIQAGAITVPMGGDELVLARLSGGNTALWKAESAAVTESDSTWERVTLKAKTVLVLQRLSRELFEDLSDEGRRAIEREIAQAIALKLDLAALEGDPAVDANSPRGIATTTGVQTVSMGANGLRPTSYDQLVQAVFAVRKQNSADPTAAIFHPRDGETLALLKDSTNQPLRKPPAIENLPTLFSSQLATNRTQGTSSDASNAYVGDYRQLLVGVRPSLQLRFQVLNERYADNLQVGLLAWLRADVALAQPAHFAKLIGLRNV